VLRLCIRASGVPGSDLAELWIEPDQTILFEPIRIRIRILSRHHLTQFLLIFKAVPVYTGLPFLPASQVSYGIFNTCIFDNMLKFSGKKENLALYLVVEMDTDPDQQASLDAVPIFLLQSCPRGLE
jgi:hypothetical protein